MTKQAVRRLMWYLNPKRNFRRTLLAVLAVIFLPLVINVVTVLPNPIDDAYAQWGAVDMVVDYMENHQGEWPTDWESLRPKFEESHGRLGGSTFEQFQKRIVIDFNANADDLRRQAIASNRPTFNVIGTRSWLAATMGDGPNAMLQSYLRRQSGIIEAPPPPGGWSSEQHRQLADKWYRRGFYVRFDADGQVVAAWTCMARTVPTSDEEVADLKSLGRLRQLNFIGSDVTDNGLKVVSQLPELEHLDLGRAISDAGLVHLSGHPRLQALDIFETKITDAGVQQLASIPHLRELRFDSRNISEEAIRELRKALPDLKIRPEGELRAPEDF